MEDRLCYTWQQDRGKKLRDLSIVRFTVSGSRGTSEGRGDPGQEIRGCLWGKKLESRPKYIGNEEKEVLSKHKQNKWTAHTHT